LTIDISESLTKVLGMLWWNLAILHELQEQRL